VRFWVREWFDGHEDVLQERLWDNRFTPATGRVAPANLPPEPGPSG
jgi:hypothetical protein